MTNKTPTVLLREWRGSAVGGYIRTSSSSPDSLGSEGSRLEVTEEA